MLKRATFSGEAKALRFSVNPAVGGPGAYYQSISTGFEVGMPKEEIHDGLEIYREYRSGAGVIRTASKWGNRLQWC